MVIIIWSEGSKREVLLQRTHREEVTSKYLEAERHRRMFLWLQLLLNAVYLFFQVGEAGKQCGNCVELLQFNVRVEQGTCCSSSSSPPAGRKGSVDLKYSFSWSLTIICSDLAVSPSKAAEGDPFFPSPSPACRIAVQSLGQCIFLDNLDDVQPHLLKETKVLAECHRLG